MGREEMENYFNEMLRDTEQEPRDTEQRPRKNGRQDPGGLANGQGKDSGLAPETVPSKDPANSSLTEPKKGPEQNGHATLKEPEIIVKAKLQSLLTPELPTIEPAPKQAPPSELKVKPKEAEKGIANIAPVKVAESKPPEFDAQNTIAKPLEKPSAIEMGKRISPKKEGPPEWGQSDFDALLIKVSGLTLAVPLVSLGQIYPLTEKLTPIFGQSDWFMGLFATPAGNVKIVNTALFVMPERYQTDFVDNYHYAVSLHNSGWALAVDSVQQPSRLSPDHVTWRNNNGKRLWLAGTVKSAMCALIDIPRLVNLLNLAEKPVKS